jgi:hypothetical protein
MADSSQKANQPSMEKELARLGERLIQESVVYFPVRHHSPACAWHLKRLIESHKPASILIEGPETLNHLIPHLSDPDLKAPVALYSQFVDYKGYTEPDTPGDKPEKAGPNRFAAFYPLCDYSPELVAIRLGTRLKAKIALCDLDFAVQTIIEHRLEDESTAQTAVSLFDERYLAQNRYLQALARRSGCRDTNELWDRLFESEFCREDTPGFMRKVAAYCFFARRNTPHAQMLADGTLAREKRMATLIRNELRRLKRRNADRPLLVVTGGFHTVSLAMGPDRLENLDLPTYSFSEKELVHAVIPYSYRQMDALNGYAAGMPAPYYYQKIWESAENTGQADPHAVGRDMLVELSRRSREINLPYPLSTADAVAANQLSADLARFRRNPGPMREDILDGIRASFTKGALDAEGDVVMALARDMFCGDAVGFLPKHIRTHPLIEDFRNQAERLGLQLDSTRQQAKVLNIYNSEKHRKISRFFRMLDFLGIPFAQFRSGPDFISGTALSLTVEHWTYGWSPMTESALVDISLKGGSILEAVRNTLQERREAIQEEGPAADTTAAIGLLLISCRLGLHDMAEGFTSFVNDTIAAENRFEVGIYACHQLDLLHQFKSPLETRRLAALPQLLETAFRRSCFLLARLPHLPLERQEAALDALPEARALMADGRNSDILDGDLFWQAIATLLSTTTLEPGLEGGLLGMGFTAGKFAIQEVLDRLEAQAVGRDEKGNRLARFIKGLFLLCRELSWSHEPVMAAISAIVQGWDDETFFQQLPDLRLAFASHTPQETDLTAKLVAGIHKGEPLDWYVREWNEGFVSRCAAVAARVAESLKTDGLIE